MRAEALQELLQTPGGAGELLLLLHEAAAEAGEQRLASFPPRAMAWLVLSPGWPVSLVSAGFPGDEALLRDSAAIALLRSIVAANICTIQTGEPPWQEEWFVLSAEQQAVAIAVLSARFADEPEFFADQLREAAACMRGAIVGRTAPPQLERWMALAGEPLSDRRGVEAIAATLDAQVAAAIAQAHAAEQLACPAALRWIETAEPLMPIFFSSLELAIARSYRRLELFDRRSRDERLLRNAVSRPRQEAVIVALLADETAWALHVMGHGGAGKTMLMRRVKTVLAEKHNLAVARIDFDNLNPNYPTRAPGLLLMGFAEELRLSDDAQAVDVFRRFDLSIRGVHERLESAVRVGSAAAAGGADRLEASYVEAENAFIAALQIIAREKRPLLILDTCEELAKARSVAGASTALQATFALLERLHREVPSLRVILSGRRRLAGGGHGWTAAGSALPERHFLQLVNLRWFDEDEAKEFLVGYTNEGLRLQAHLRQPILDELASNEHDPNRSIVWTAPPPTEVEGPRYNPYDLDMLASLGAQEPPPEPSVFASGRETYVRERIVGRVSAGVRSILAEIAILGRFDRDLVMRLLGGAGPDSEKIWDDLCDEPWIEVDRAARGGSSVWGMEPQLQERVCTYYKHAETASWHAARLRLRTLLPTITQERDWSELTPSYFVLALDMLANDPAAAARWWASVESHVAEKGVWEWAREITSLLLDEDDSGGASRCGLRAAVLALQAAAMLRLAPDQLGRLWKAVGDEAGRHPNRATQVMLSYRALAGAASDLRCRPDSVTESGIGALQEIVDRVPPFETLETGSAQAFGTEIGFIENCIELIERIEWRRSPPLSLLEPLRRRAELLHSLAAPSLGAYAKCLSARILALSNSVSVPEFDVPAEWQDVPLHFLDWVAPTHLAARIRLEAARLNPRTLDLFRSSIDPLQSLDDDRYWSIRLQVAADHRPIMVPDRAIADSLRLARLPPDYVGHIAVPPLFCVGLEQRAMGGAPQESVAALSGAAADRSLPLETRLAAQRSAVRIGIRFRLYASPAVPYNLLEQSSRLSDAVLLAGRHALDPRQTDAEYAGRWRGAVAALAARGQDPKIEPSIEPDAAFAALSLALDDAEGDPERLPRPELQRWEEKHNGAWLESATLHARLGFASKARPRREASLLLDEGSFLALRQPALGASLLEVAVHLYHLVGDVAGEQLASISAALACARAGDRDRLQAILERPVLASDAVEQALGPPWLYRLALARCRLEEFDQPGPATAAWLNSDGVGWKVGADMVGVVAGPHRAPPASMRARVPRASRAGKGIAVLLSMLATVLTAAAGVFGTLAIGETAAALAILAVEAALSIHVFRWYVLVGFWLARGTVELHPLDPVADANAPVRSSHTSLRHSSGSLSRTATLARSGATDYITLSRDLMDRTARWVLRSPVPLVTTLLPWFMMRGVKLRLSVDPSCAALAWEAVFNMRGRATPVRSFCFRFYRTGIATPASGAAPMIRPVGLELLAERGGPGARSIWANLVKGKSDQYRFGMSWGPLPIMLQTSVLHVICDVVEGASGLEIELSRTGAADRSEASGAGRNVTVSPRSLIVGRGSIPRLCILQGFAMIAVDRHGASLMPPRGDVDRHGASLMRRAAAELFDAGVMAVLVIPSLPEPMNRDVLAPVVKAIAGGSRGGNRALRRAVYDMQKMIAPAKEDQDAHERALDVCLYCTPDLSFAAVDQ